MITMIINMNGAKAPETPSPVLQEKTVTPETLPTVIGADEGYDGLIQVTVNPDAQLKAENIRSGKTIFGVAGAFNGNGDKTDIEVKLLTCMKGIENDYTITTEELKAYYADGLMFNGMPYTIIPWGRVGTMDLSGTYSSNFRNGILTGVGNEYRYPFVLKLKTLSAGSGGSISTADPYPFVKCAIQRVEIATPSDPYLTSIGTLFYKCYFYSDLVIPEGYTETNGALIYECRKNKTVGTFDPAPMTLVLPSTITYMGSETTIRFTSSYKGTIVMKAATPPNLNSSANIEYCAKIVVPKGSLTAYQTATNWSKFADIMEEATE